MVAERLEDKMIRMWKEMMSEARLIEADLKSFTRFGEDVIKSISALSELDSRDPRVRQALSRLMCWDITLIESRMRALEERLKSIREQLEKYRVECPHSVRETLEANKMVKDRFR